MTGMEIVFNSLMEKFSGFGGLALGAGTCSSRLPWKRDLRADTKCIYLPLQGS